MYAAHPLPAGYTEEGLITTDTARLVEEAGTDLFQVERDETGRPRVALVSDELGDLDRLGIFTVTGAGNAPMRRLVLQVRATQTLTPEQAALSAVPETRESPDAPTRGSARRAAGD